ncbi:hypothetical protein HFP89_10410 [Wenzhouxiangella sp. XN79A]|uniref:hypothetical protein n=1 Tax=Wenzhouxiangella sp. XN79A TaxID=2724193 RepID=UPI00144AA44D|nr:hypothetical protein [Wenzhouxiangella sp. XN79A]NKI35577.1 hypothetical protein [Wenzhouxiangella sp. XN79A]
MSAGPEPTDRAEALARIAELARHFEIGPDEIGTALAGGPQARAAGAPDRVRTLLALVGGLFVLAGLVGLLQLIWSDLAPFARVVAVFGSGAVLLALGLVADRDEAFERAASPLLLVAGLFQTAGLFVLLDEYPTGFDDALDAMLVFGAMAVQFGALFAGVKRADLLFLLLVAGTLFLSAALAWLDVDGEWVALMLGGSGLLLSFGLERTPWHGLCGLAWVSYAVMAAFGLFEVVEGSFPADLLLIAFAALIIQLSVHVARRALLVAGVGIMLACLGYYTGEYFADVFGWPIALIAFGLVLLALSGYAWRVGRRIAASNHDRSHMHGSPPRE